MKNKIRVWDKEEERFVESDYLYDDAFNFYHKNGKDVFIGKQFDFIIQEFTGIKDKYEKDIFEGDFVRFWTGSTRYNKKGIVRLVEYYDDINSGYDQHMILYPFHDMEYIDGEQGDYFDSNQGFEVIGNIFENPELIKN